MNFEKSAIVFWAAQRDIYALQIDSFKRSGSPRALVEIDRREKVISLIDGFIYTQCSNRAVRL